MLRRLIAGLMLAVCASGAAAQDWRTLPPPQTTQAIIESNPMQGFYSWLGPDIVPVDPPSPDHYLRLSWAELEPREGVYDFSRLEAAMASPEGHRRRCAHGGHTRRCRDDRRAVASAGGS